jgi:hypothetical protein
VSRRPLKTSRVEHPNAPIAADALTYDSISHANRASKFASSRCVPFLAQPAIGQSLPSRLRIAEKSRWALPARSSRKPIQFAFNELAHARALRR